MVGDVDFFHNTFALQKRGQAAWEYTPDPGKASVAGVRNGDCSYSLTGTTSERTTKAGACHRYLLPSTSGLTESLVGTHQAALFHTLRSPRRLRSSRHGCCAALNCVSEGCLKSTFLFKALVAKTGVFMPRKNPTTQKYGTVVKTRPGLAKTRHVGAHLLGNLSNSAT